MKPVRNPQATLNDLLDRLLDKGLLLNTDLIVSVAGIPLLGVNLKLALAGMETMLEYGIMRDWDEAQRAVAAKETERETPHLEEDEYVIFSVFGTHWYQRGIYGSWRPGTVYVTNKRLIIFRKTPAEVLFQTGYEEIRGLALLKREHFSGDTRQELHLLIREDETAQLHTKDTLALKKAIEKALKINELGFEDNLILPAQTEAAGNFLQPEEEIALSGRVWYLMADGSARFQWRPGYLYLTDKRLCWWYDFEKRLLVDIPSDQLMHVTLKDGEAGEAPVREKSLLVLYKEGEENKVVCFSCNEPSLRKWEKFLRLRTKDHKLEKSTETCPRCGKKATREILLEQGCSRCGWVSHRIK